ncbi:MAG: hypothetical protein AAFX99_12200 [Myxococcota bacterium]
MAELPQHHTFRFIAEEGLGALSQHYRIVWRLPEAYNALEHHPHARCSPLFEQHSLHRETAV